MGCEVVLKLGMSELVYRADGAEEAKTVCVVEEADQVAREQFLSTESDGGQEIAPPCVMGSHAEAGGHSEREPDRDPKRERDRDRGCEAASQSAQEPEQESTYGHS